MENHSGGTTLVRKIIKETLEAQKRGQAREDLLQRLKQDAQIEGR